MKPKIEWEDLKKLLQSTPDTWKAVEAVIAKELSGFTKPRLKKLKREQLQSYFVMAAEGRLSELPPSLKIVGRIVFEQANTSDSILESIIRNGGEIRISYVSHKFHLHLIVAKNKISDVHADTIQEAMNKTVKKVLKL